ncbi:methyl-accepting chemotaxis protein [Candidatus Sumerlaeota bacterium]|nr:methyl-accepting chemotaxis protein [Candidatus Sumerlaeota bacterium]
MTATEQNRRRPFPRRYVIDLSFQWRYLRNILLVELLVVGLTIFVTLAVDHLLLSPGMPQTGYWRNLTLSVVVMCGGFAMILIMIGLILSHRIAGPLFRIRQVLLGVAQGELPDQCRIRQRDEHGDVAEALSSALTTLRNRRDADCIAWREQAQRLSALAEGAAGELAKSLRGLSHAAELRGK